MTKRYQALQEGDDLDFWGNSRPKCPHCGAMHNMDDRYALYEEGEHLAICDACDLHFTIHTRVSIEFDTDRQEGFQRDE